MKSGIHPVYESRSFHCYGCGEEWNTRTTLKPTSSDGKIHLDICSKCHPFFTGKQKMLDKAGRVDRFRKRYAKVTSDEPTDKVEKSEMAAAAEKASIAARTEKVSVAAKFEKAIGAVKPDNPGTPGPLEKRGKTTRTTKPVKTEK